MSWRKESKARLIEARARMLNMGVEQLIPPDWGKWRRSGDEIRDERNHRSINARTGLWRDLRNGERSGDLISFVAMELMRLSDCRGVNFTAALERLSAEAGMTSDWRPSEEDIRHRAKAERSRETENRRAAKARCRAFDAFCWRIRERRRAIS